MEPWNLSRAMYAWGGKTRWFHIVASIVVSGVALWFTEWLWRGEAESLLIFALAILVSALFFGPGAAVLTAILTAAIAIRFVLEPVGKFAVTDEHDLRVLLAFVAVAGISVLLARALHVTQVRLRRLLNEREDTLAVVAHDLRNPLTRIQLDASLAQRGLDAAGANTNQVRRLQRIQAAAGEMNRFVADLLFVAQAEAGSLALQKRPFVFEKCLQAAVERSRAVAGEQNVTIHTEIDTETSWVGDGDRILQLFFNLFGNAVKFSREGGRIWVRCTILPQEIRVAVEDDGPGIRPEDQARLFERFWQGGRARTDIGLGLYICKKIAEAHGGKIWVESDGRSGSTFFVTFPRET